MISGIGGLQIFAVRPVCLAMQDQHFRTEFLSNPEMPMHTRTAQSEPVECGMNLFASFPAGRAKESGQNLSGLRDGPVAHKTANLSSASDTPLFSMSSTSTRNTSARTLTKACSLDYPYAKTLRQFCGEKVSGAAGGASMRLVNAHLRSGRSTTLVNFLVPITLSLAG